MCPIRRAISGPLAYEAGMQPNELPRPVVVLNARSVSFLAYLKLQHWRTVEFCFHSEYYATVLIVRIGPY